MALAVTACSDDSTDNSEQTSATGSGGNGGNTSAGQGGSGGGGSGQGGSSTASGGTGGTGQGGAGGQGGGGQGGAGGQGPAPLAPGDLYGPCTPNDSCNDANAVCYTLYAGSTPHKQCILDFSAEPPPCTGPSDTTSCPATYPYAEGNPICEYIPDPFHTCLIDCAGSACPTGLQCVTATLNGSTPRQLCVP